MGLFGKKEQDPQLIKLNQYLRLALSIDDTTMTWTELPDELTDEIKDQIIAVRKLSLEYIRQLKEAKVYSNNAVSKFIKEEYSWVSKENIMLIIQLGQYI